MISSQKRINTRFKNLEQWVQININPEYIIAVVPHKEIISSCLILLVNNPGWVEIDCYYNNFLKQLGKGETVN
jgi:hypothetical protein